MTTPRKDAEFSPKVAAAAARDDDDDDDDDDKEAGVTTPDVRASLIGNKTASNASLDSYDRTKNPFFAH